MKTGIDKSSKIYDEVKQYELTHTNKKDRLLDNGKVILRKLQEKIRNIYIMIYYYFCKKNQKSENGEKFNERQFENKIYNYANFLMYQHNANTNRQIITQLLTE
ncbi:hypothetical protein A3Q56_08118 [Intoshia linei]|uniref:Uncharacterized protein n=1 Tax=Intoshia linei TaxID=1819745 RepID=A0A177ARM8_9BILA|nr:hypothetical protein A3Q56_08118 [Intoshia linei]